MATPTFYLRIACVNRAEAVESLRLLLPRYFERTAERFEFYGLDAKSITVLEQGTALTTWLNQQPHASVGLLLLGSKEVDEMPTLRDMVTGENRHPALHPQARLVGWSLSPDVAADFQRARADGFILKGQPLEELANQITDILHYRKDGVEWYAVR